MIEYIANENSLYDIFMVYHSYIAWNLYALYLHHLNNHDM